MDNQSDDIFTLDWIKKNRQESRKIEVSPKRREDNLSDYSEF